MKEACEIPPLLLFASAEKSGEHLSSWFHPVFRPLPDHFLPFSVMIQCKFPFMSIIFILIAASQSAFSSLPSGSIALKVAQEEVRKAADDDAGSSVE